MIKDYRKQQYEKNCELISMIQEHNQSDIICERIQDVYCGELEINIGNFLNAYQDGDVDAMACAITGWDLETLLAKAKVIPDVKHNFYQDGEVPSSEIVFPLYGKAEWTEEDFVTYLRKDRKVSVEVLRLIQNAMSYAKTMYEAGTGRQNFLCSMLHGVCDIDDETIRKVVL